MRSYRRWDFESAGSGIVLARSFMLQEYVLSTLGQLWPWPWSDDLHIRTWPVLAEDIHRMCKYELRASNLSKDTYIHTYRQTRQTESTEIINHVASRVVSKTHMSSYRCKTTNRSSMNYYNSYRSFHIESLFRKLWVNSHDTFARVTVMQYEQTLKSLTYRTDFRGHTWTRYKMYIKMQPLRLKRYKTVQHYWMR